MNNETNLNFLNDITSTQVPLHSGSILSVPQTSIFEKKQPKFKKLTLKYERKGKKKEKNAENYVCRVCLGEEEDEEPDNCLICPCNCAGTMKYIHL